MLAENQSTLGHTWTLTDTRLLRWPSISQLLADTWLIYQPTVSHVSVEYCLSTSGSLAIPDQPSTITEPTQCIGFVVLTDIRPILG